ncbi:hypothetical protein C7J88_06220 [Staphylococcus muscae]|uniref:Uncharacterized protein n=1 Tax=Staphylococcus muscae TaxID=1294 RepID=A0ABQ1HU94_9STAP|nr:hypothetical protein C7J88_06220 [Staphylococcus muscae]GGA87719.1 hypothetical protein GCM10007183_09880 [Staphylococcus muscae]
MTHKGLTAFKKVKLFTISIIILLYITLFNFVLYAINKKGIAYAFKRFYDEGALRESKKTK